VTEPERAEAFLRDLDRLRNQVLAARDRYPGEPHLWGGWSRRWVQRLRGLCARHELLTADDYLETDEDDHLGCLLVDAASSLYELWDAYNLAAGLECCAGDEEHFGIAERRVEFERDLAAGRSAIEEMTRA
jgi:hypothetical protein